MSSPSSQFAAPSGAIVGPCFCVPDPIDLTFFIDAASLNCDHLAVTDINGNVVFKVEAHKWSLRNRQVVVDASGNPVISMHMKLRSVHDRWQVFMGNNSSDPQHLLFSVKRSSALQFKTELDVFLATNTEEEVCDFKIKGSFRNRSCTVYKGDSSTVVAQMSKEYKLVNGLVSKDAFGVTVNPNTDYSFITALTIIRHEFFKIDTVISDAISDEISDEISDGISSAISAAQGEIDTVISDGISEISAALGEIDTVISDAISADEISDGISSAISAAQGEIDTVISDGISEISAALGEIDTVISDAISADEISDGISSAISAAQGEIDTVISDGISEISAALGEIDTVISDAISADEISDGILSAISALLGGS